MQFNPWHSVSYGSEAPDFVDAIIEIPRGSRGKYELDKASGMLRLDRVLFHSVHYPMSYGFIPRTYCDDKDPLDILVISQITIPSMCIVNAKVIGVMRMVDQGEADDKIIAVCADDMSVNHYNDLTELPEFILKEVKQFFEEYKKLEEKEVVVDGFQNADEAKKIVQKAIADYKDYAVNLK